MDNNELGALRPLDDRAFVPNGIEPVPVSPVPASIPSVGSRLAAAIERGEALGKRALYFGCLSRPGHFLHSASGRTIYDARRDMLDLPWGDALMDTGLLKNGKRKDICDGKVFWTAGGLAFWYAFFWWDRSVDTRGASNSGFYVRGFGWPAAREAFDYACAQFPSVVQRQKYPLILQDKSPAQAIEARRAETSGSACESAVLGEDAPNV